MLEALDLARLEDEGLGEDRAKTIGEIWRPILKHFGEKRDASRLTVGDVQSYVGKRRKVVAGQTVKREREALVRALRLAKRDRLLRALPFDPDDLPAIRFDPPKRAQKGKVWRIEQVAAVFANFSKKALRAKHLERCELILLTGLRMEELHRLHPSWVVPLLRGPVPAVLSIPEDGAKWGKAREVPLVPRALEIIKTCAPFPRKKPNKSLALASKNAGLNGVLTPRDLRTMFLTAAGAADPVATQHLGGHTTMATTLIYMKSNLERAIAATVNADEFFAKVPSLVDTIVAEAAAKKAKDRNG